VQADIATPVQYAPIAPDVTGRFSLQYDQAGMHLHVEQRQKVSCVCRDDRQVIFVSIAPYGAITGATEPDVRHRRTIASKGGDVRYQRRRQVFIEKKFHTEFRLPSRDGVPKVSVGGLEVDSCARE
jgi:hypothetical protein